MATPPSPATGVNNPTGFYLRDGFASLLCFSANASVHLWEKTIKPPGIDGGDPTDISTMHNLVWHTMAPRKLKKMDTIECVCAYAPAAYSDMLSLINVHQTVTVFFPEGKHISGTGINDGSVSTLAFYAYVQKFEPQELKEGEMPLANVTIVLTNTDPTGAEAGPVFTSGTGS